MTGEWLQECLKERTKVPMDKFAVLDPKCANAEKTNEGNEKTQQFEKSDKTGDKTLSNPEHLDKGTTAGKCPQTPLIDAANASPMTPAPHPRIASLKGVFPSSSPDSPKTPPPWGDATPITSK